MSSRPLKDDLSELRYFLQYYYAPKSGAVETLADAVEKFQREAIPERLTATLEEVSTLLSALRDNRAAAPADQPAHSNAHPTHPDIEIINPPRDPNPSTGLFVVTIVTRQKGKLSDRKLLVSASTHLDIQQETPDGLAKVTTYTPWSEGIYQLHIGFDGRMIEVFFVVDSGETASVHLRK